MINAELGHVKTLKEFHDEITKQQTEAHGEGYNDIHEAIQKYIKDCNTYMELGTHQGGTAAAAMLAKPKNVILIDIDMSRYYKFLSPIADKWCSENNINLTIKQCSSIELGSIANTDMLMIDSVHNPNHMSKELALHGGNVNKYILAHDTSVLLGQQNDALFRVLDQFAKTNGWKVIERGTINAGYTVLKK